MRISITMNAENDVIKEVSKLNGLKPSERNKLIVDKIRHLRMDPIVFDNTDNQKYLTVYVSVMQSISGDYPPLEQEVQRQINKKIRWQNRRNESVKSE